MFVTLVILYRLEGVGNHHRCEQVSACAVRQWLQLADAHPCWAVGTAPLLPGVPSPAQLLQEERSLTKGHVHQRRLLIGNQFSSQ